MSLTAQFVRNLRSFRLVTFDVTDTLVKLNDPIGQYVATAAACGVVGLDKSKMAACFGQQFKWMSKTYPNFGCSSSSSPSIKWQDWWRQLVTRTFACVDNQIPSEKVAIIAEELLTLFRTSACWTPVPGAQELVHRMRLAGKCVGVISNFDPSVVQVLDAMGFGQQFDFILCSYEAGVMKPDPGIFQLALRQAKISSANQALHIGNKYDMDYAGARQSGWSSLLVQPHLDAQLEAAAHHTFGSLAEMLEALETQEIRW
ncbi:rhythmically expressed gene 2 protein [Drosophila albomicans]|uniref:Rhythmically expressed gene 2 protein n=1 Tax=Drosophila albomicans TaxID=7291 RepID=A0A6P8XD96_DROAB|nr:rhythmically expressed gene 2 protein [Drosophila albomicans]